MGVSQLGFTMQSQLQSNWCWAAVSASVAQFFGTVGPSGTLWQQCEIVNGELGQTTCCANGMTASCNRDWQLDLALTRIGHLAGPIVVGPVAFSDVEGEVDGGRPVGVRIGWYGGGGHFVAISGYDDSNGGQQLDIDDPYYGPSTYDYNSFVSGYQSGAGQWTHSYPIA